MSVLQVAWAAKATAGTGTHPQAVGGPPDGHSFAVTDTTSPVELREFHETTLANLVDLLATVTFGDRATPETIAAADFIAFEHNGDAPGLSGGWESCDWTFDDGDNVVAFHWDQGTVDGAPGGAPLPRDPHVLANGSISGAAFARHFGIDQQVVLAENPSAGSLERVVISFLLFRLGDDLDLSSPSFRSSVAVSAGSPDIDGVGILRHRAALRVDTRRLTFSAFTLADTTLGPLGASGEQLLELPAGEYQFLQLATRSRFGFIITPAGLVDYPAALDRFLGGRGSSTLLVRGVDVDVDGSRLSHHVRLLVDGNQQLPAAASLHLVLLPAPAYPLQATPLGAVTFTFAVAADGAVDPVDQGVAFGEVGRLNLTGYDVVIDARRLLRPLQLGVLGPAVSVSNLSRTELRLMPGRYALTADGPDHVDVGFSLDLDGTITPLEVPGGPIVMRSAPPPPTLRTFYADRFLPDHGSARAFRDAAGQHPGLRAAIRVHQSTPDMPGNLARLWLTTIDDLFDGATSEEEEDRALEILLGARSAGDLTFLVNKLTWDQLDDELDESDLTQIMDRLKALLDRRDYLVGFLIRWFFLLDDASIANVDLVGALAPFAAQASADIRHRWADMCLFQVDPVLDGIAHQALRLLPTHVGEFRAIVDNAAGPEQYRPAALQTLSWEAFYTELICSELARGEFALLANTLPDLVNPGGPGFPFPARNNAFFNMLRRWERHFLAMDRLITVVGSERQRADMRRFMDARRTFMNNFPVVAAAPPGGPPAVAAFANAVASITNALSGVNGTFTDLVAAVRSLADAIGTINTGQLLGTADDDDARLAVNTLSEAGLLAVLPTGYKGELIHRMLIGATGDEEEESILTTLRETKTRSPAEFLQLAAGATWESLDSSFDGDEYDQLVGLFRF